MYRDCTDHLKMFDETKPAKRVDEQINFMLRFVLRSVTNDLRDYFRDGIDKRLLDIHFRLSGEMTNDRQCVEMLRSIDHIFDKVIDDLNDFRDICNEIVYKYFKESF